MQLPKSMPPMLACADFNPDCDAAPTTCATAGPGVILNMKFMLQKEIANAMSMPLPPLY
jgi:hypothetical protein